MLITVTSLFGSGRIARMALNDLVEAGVPSSDISVVTHEGDVASLNRSAETAESAGTGASIGGVLGGTGGLLAGLGIIAIPGLGPVVAAGWLAATAAGVVAGAAAGGLVGALVDLGVSKEDAEFYLEGIQGGGTLLTVRVDETHKDEIRAILDTHGPIAHGDEPAIDPAPPEAPPSPEGQGEERFILTPLR